MLILKQAPQYRCTLEGVYCTGDGIAIGKVVGEVCVSVGGQKMVCEDGFLCSVLKWWVGCVRKRSVGDGQLECSSQIPD